jgi:hypothetical protein
MQKSNVRIIRVLKKMKTYLNKGWCQCAEARDKNGKPCDPRSRKATSWCLTGAVDKATGNASDANCGLYMDVLEQVGNKGGKCIEYWNDADGRKKEEVLELIDNLIIELEGK